MRVDDSIEAPKVLYEDDRGVKWYVLEMLERVRAEALEIDVQRAKAVGGPIWKDEKDDRVGFAGVMINGVE